MWKMFFWFSGNISQQMSIVVDLIEKKANFHFPDKTGGKENTTLATH